MASKFEYYLRTGRRRRVGTTSLETKFNPWHDVENGRFTFAGQGRFFPGRGLTRRRTGDDGFSGNGGDFGGGGSGDRREWASEGRASGSPTPNDLNRDAPDSTIVVRATPVRPKAAAVQQQSRLTLHGNGYDYVVDAHARPRRVSGELKLQSQRRSNRVQLNAGKPDRRSTDHGGHYNATRFNGPREWFNHFAQDSNFNQSGYRTLENEWARTIRSGKRVFVDIIPHYRGTSMRPYKLTVHWNVDGRRSSKDFQNEPGGK